MDEHNEKMLETLREIDAVVAAALRDQPEEVEHLRRHLNKALALIEFKAHCSRRALVNCTHRLPGGDRKRGRNGRAVKAAIT